MTTDSKWICTNKFIGPCMHVVMSCICVEHDAIWITHLHFDTRFTLMEFYTHIQHDAIYHAWHAIYHEWFAIYHEWHAIYVVQLNDMQSTMNGMQSTMNDMQSTMNDSQSNMNDLQSAMFAIYHEWFAIYHEWHAIYMIQLNERHKDMWTFTIDHEW